MSDKSLSEILDRHAARVESDRQKNENRVRLAQQLEHDFRAFFNKDAQEIAIHFSEQCAKRGVYCKHELTYVTRDDLEHTAWRFAVSTSKQFDPDGAASILLVCRQDLGQVHLERTTEIGGDVQSSPVKMRAITTVTFEDYLLDFLDAVVEAQRF